MAELHGNGGASRQRQSSTATTELHRDLGLMSTRLSLTQRKLRKVFYILMLGYVLKFHNGMRISTASSTAGSTASSTVSSTACSGLYDWLYDELYGKLYGDSEL